ncbi:hypothetical protein BSL78_25033 [Apostichopus japonicus]|uniref:Reverse transcriptase domain-containing protein n=1 Tax=Stichopus japonicus TaxID=307972 RepID=A0A2G8JQS3_STIJA|nr:hypothetical protein BSL78_25033 [Apostichopus japonicus]
MWAATVDLRDAYLHILVHKDHRRFLTFRYAEQDYQFRALPFGLSTAPRVFTRIAGAVVSYLRRRGVTLYVYLDDWLVVGSSQSEAADNVHKTLHTLRELGWIVNEKKSRLSPTQTTQFLGAILDFSAGVARPSEERITAVRTTTQQILSHQESPKMMWLRALGLMASLVDVVRLCRLHMRPLQLHLLKSADPTDPDMTTPIHRSEETTQHLRWWLDPDNWSQGVPFTIELPMTSVTTDASLTGWGAHWSNRTAWGTWSPTERSFHINILEMIAVKRALETFNEHIQGTITTVFTDNTTVVAYINRQGGTHSEKLCRLAWEVITAAEDSGTILRASHIAGKLNVMADALSRGHLDPNEWTLEQETCNRIFAIFGKPMIDLFATYTNSKLQTFCSRRFHPQAYHTDAMSLPWDHLEAYVFPPLCMVGQVLRKIRNSKGRFILIAPFWPRRPWFAEIPQLLMDVPASLMDPTEPLDYDPMEDSFSRSYEPEEAPITGGALPQELMARAADIFRRHLGFEEPETQPQKAGRVSKLTATGEMSSKPKTTMPVDATCYDRFEAIADKNRWTAFPARADRAVRVPDEAWRALFKCPTIPRRPKKG